MLAGVVHAVMTADSQQVFTVLGLTAAGVLLVSLGAAMVDFRSQGDTFLVSVLLGLILQLSWLIRSGPPGPMLIGETAWMAVLDFIGLGVMLLLLRARFAWWKLAMAATFLTMLAAHAGVHWGWLQGRDGRYNYIVSLNVLTFSQLCLLGAIGGRCVANAIDDGLFGHRRDPVHAGHGVSR